MFNAFYFIFYLMFYKCLIIFVTLMFISSFPEIEFFHSESVREQLLDILFCYARVNKKLDYKQVGWTLLHVLMKSFFQFDTDHLISWGRLVHYFWKKGKLLTYHLTFSLLTVFLKLGIIYIYVWIRFFLYYIFVPRNIPNW